MGYLNDPFADPARDWDEDDGYEYDDTKVDLDEAEDGGFYGTGLVVGEDGELALVIANGAMDEWDAFRLTEVEARGLAAMIDAVLG